MTTPDPVASADPCLVHGFERSGCRIVEKTFTTALSASWEMAAVGSGEGVAATTEPASLLASPAGGGSAAAKFVESSNASKPQQKGENSERVIRMLYLVTIRAKSSTGFWHRLQRPFAGAVHGVVRRRPQPSASLRPDLQDQPI